MIARLRLERISLRGICRAMGVGLQWLLQFMVGRFQEAPEHLYVEPPSSTPAVILQRVEAELDELTLWCERAGDERARVVLRAIREPLCHAA